MNPLDHSLQKLLDAASHARPDLPTSPPSSLQAAIVVQIRGGPAEDEFASLLRMFRQATIFAVIVMVLSGAWNYLGDNGKTGATAMLHGSAYGPQLIFAGYCPC